MILQLYALEHLCINMLIILMSGEHEDFLNLVLVSFSLKVSLWTFDYFWQNFVVTRLNSCMCILMLILKKAINNLKSCILIDPTFSLIDQPFSPPVMYLLLWNFSILCIFIFLGFLFNGYDIGLWVRCLMWFLDLGLDVSSVILLCFIPLHMLYYFLGSI